MSRTEYPEPSLIERFHPALLRRIFKNLLFEKRSKLSTNFYRKAFQESQRLGFKYKKDLRIKGMRELLMYQGKSAYLAVSYAGFGVDGTRNEALGAGKAGFLSCAYDVVTDWRSHDKEYFKKTLQKIFDAESPGELAQMGMQLCEKDSTKKLEQDGLERGIVAFNFVTKLMGTDHYFQDKTDTNNLGILLQIVDDVLDYEADLASGDENCLTSERKLEYLQKLISEFTDKKLAELFQPNSVLVTTIQYARDKACKLLSQ